MSNSKYPVPEVIFKTLDGGATLADAFEVCLAAESIEQKVKGAFTGAFDTMRKHAVEVYRQFLAEAKDKPEDIKVSSMVGVFLHQCEVAEAIHPGETSRTWTNYKSKFKSAMENGINLQDNSAIGYSKLSSALKTINDEAERKSADAAKAAAKKDGKVVDQAVTNVADTGSQEGSGTGDTKVTDNILSGLSPDVRAVFESLISTAKDMDSADAKQKVMNILGSTQAQLSSAHKKALAHLKAAA